MKKTGRIIVMLAVLAFVATAFVLVPKKAKAEGNPAQIYVGDEEVFYYSEQMWRNVGNGWSYDEKTNTLCLHGNYNFQYTGGSYNRRLVCILVEGDANIVVDGPTVINLGNNGLVGISVNGNCNLTLKSKLTINGGGGIYVSGNMTITGEKDGKYVSKPKGHVYGGLWTEGNLSIKDVQGIKITTPTLFAMHTMGGNIDIKDSKIDVSAYTGGIVAFYGNIKISGKNEINAKAAASGAPAIGVVTKNETQFIGSPTGKGKGKIKLGKKVKVTTPSGVNVKKTKTIKKTFPIVKGSDSKIKLTMVSFKGSSLGTINIR